VLLRWEAAYETIHPEVHFDNHLNSPATVMAGLYDGVADLALMGRELWPVETMAYHWVYQQQPFGVVVLTAGLNAPDQSFTPVVIVNSRNPLTSISISQLDGIYGSEHRITPANVRTWGELGLTGKWARQPIHAYGFGPEDSLGVFFRHDVLRLDFKPNPESKLLSDHDSATTSAAQRINRAIAADPYAIGYTRLSSGSAVKLLAVASPAVTWPSQATLGSHQYALTRSLSIYCRRFPGKPLDPRLDQFLHFVLSSQAQDLVRPFDGFLPLNAVLMEEQRQKLDAPLAAVSGSDWKEQ
jgi:phosphate transport system substrate-binding protein